MIARLGLVALVALIALSTACGDDDDEPAVTTAATASPTSTTEAEETPSPTQAPTLQPTAVASATPAPQATPPPQATPAPTGEIGPGAIWEIYDHISALYDTCPMVDDIACVSELATERGASAEATAFFEQTEYFLYSFEELGVVDYGLVTSPFFNMSRPEPVFLNGGFGVLFFGALFPEDWQTRPSYEGLPEFVIAWREYSSIATAAADAAGQHFEIEALISECRACQPLGYLVLDVTFDAAGSLTAVEVLPMRMP